MSPPLAMVTYHNYSTSMASRVGKGGPTDEINAFTKSGETGFGHTAEPTALPSGMRQVSICVKLAFSTCWPP